MLFAKLVMMSSAPAKSAGDARSIHSITVVPYNLDSNLYKECVLSTSNAMQMTFLCDTSTERLFLHCQSLSNWNSERFFFFFFVEGGKTREPEKTLGIRTRAINNPTHIWGQYQVTLVILAFTRFWKMLSPLLRHPQAVLEISISISNH